MMGNKKQSAAVNGQEEFAKWAEWDTAGEWGGIGQWTASSSRRGIADELGRRNGHVRPPSSSSASSSSRPFFLSPPPSFCHPQGKCPRRLEGRGLFLGHCSAPAGIPPPPRLALPSFLLFSHFLFFFFILFFFSLVLSLFLLSPSGFIDGEKAHSNWINPRGRWERMEAFEDTICFFLSL